MEEDYQRILTVGEECINEKELKALILAKGRGVDEDGEVILLLVIVVLIAAVSCHKEMHKRSNI